MYTLLVLLFISLGLFIYGFVKRPQRKKIIILLSSLGLFSLVFGFLGQVIDLVGTFRLGIADGTSSYNFMIATLKLSSIYSILGTIVFLIDRLCIIVLTLITKEVGELYQ